MHCVLLDGSGHGPFGSVAIHLWAEPLRAASVKPQFVPSNLC